MKVQFLMLLSNSSVASGSGPREKQSPRQIILSIFLFDSIILRDSFSDSVNSGKLREIYAEKGRNRAKI